MLTYYLKWKKNTEDLISKVVKTKNDRTMLLSKWAVCSYDKPRFVKEKEAKGILSSLGLEAPLSKIPLFNDSLFWMQFQWIVVISKTWKR